MKLQYAKTSEFAKLPTRAHATDSGLDLYACLNEKLTLIFGETVVVPTGIAIELPPPTLVEAKAIDGWSQGHVVIKYEAQIRSKSGIAAKQQLIVTNSPGTIDYGYSGEIKVLLTSLNDSNITIKHHQPIAQLVVCPIVIPEFTKKPGGVGALYNGASMRGEGGLGSTYEDDKEKYLKAYDKFKNITEDSDIVLVNESGEEVPIVYSSEA